MLGAGRETKDSAIDYSAGIIIHKKTGEAVKQGEVMATLYADDAQLFEAAAAEYRAAVRIEDEKPKKEPLIYARVTADAVERFDLT